MSTEHPVAGSSALKAAQRYTLEQWRQWPQGQRWELIEGEAYNMSPAPRIRHQKIALSLAGKLEKYLEGKTCQPFIAPVDVYLATEEGDTVVQPDVLVVCDPHKVQDNGVHGAPDFVAEVLSESTALKDLGTKRELYEKVGVKEYWVVSPDDGTVFRYVLEGSRFARVVEFRRGEAVESSAVQGFVWTSP